MAVEIVKSPHDRRIYRRITLENRLTCLLVSDPEMAAGTEADEPPAEDQVKDNGMEEGGEGVDPEDDEDDMLSQHVKKAAAAMSVGVGSFSDPDDVQGLSHYLEHMLFMGSERYPDENSYDAYLTSHGGSANAFTEMESTNYHFDCKPDALRGALDRFAQFFIAPLCKADALEREVSAVDNEFTGTLQDDSSRLAQLRCHTARPGHMYTKFSWGNRHSLLDLPQKSGVDVRKALLEYYKQEYSAERMALVVLGGQPLDTLEAWARELFAAVPSGRGTRPSFPATPFPYQGGRMYALGAVKQGHEVVVTWQLPSLFSQYRTKAEDYLSHFLGHEGPGSLLAALKSRGWASALSAGCGETGYERNSLTFVFEVSITLTEAGLAAEHGLAAVALVFEMVAKLRAAGPQRWAWEEMAAVAGMKFRFAEEDDAVDFAARTAGDLHLYAPEHALAGPFVHDQWKPELVEELLTYMTPEAARIDLQTSSYEAVCEAWRKLPGATTAKEPWFGVPYVEAPVPEEMLAAWRSAGRAYTPGLHLAPSNTFIASDIGLRCEAAGVQVAVSGTTEDGVPLLATPPALLSDAPGLRLWHKLDSTFRVPKAALHVRLASPAAYANPVAAAATHLLTKLLADRLQEQAYAAEVAGLTYEVWPEGAEGVDLKVEGFSHKLPLLTEMIFCELARLQVDDAKQFERVREDLARRYANANMRPEKHASGLRLRALKRVWPAEEVLKALQALTMRSAQEHIEAFFKRTHLEMLVLGNIDAGVAQSLAHTMRGTLPGEVLPAAERHREAVARLPDGASYLHRAAARNAEEDNSVAEVYFQVGPDTRDTRAAVDLLEQVVAEPAYDVLRTKEQLGYSVHASARLTHGVLGFALVVVSGTHGAAHLDARIDAFLAQYEGVLAGMPEEELEDHRASLIAAKLQKDRSLFDEAERHWDQIASGRYHFAAREEEVAVLERVSHKELLAAFRAHLLPGAPLRRRLAVHVLGRKAAGELQGAGPDVGVCIVADVDRLRDELPAFAPVEGTLPPVQHE